MIFGKFDEKAKNCSGFSLIEVLIGILLVTVIFFAIYGFYQLSLAVVMQSQNRITATAIANSRIEIIKNLPYDSIGIINGFPSGILYSSTTTVMNGISYTITSRVDYFVDSADGIASPDDACPNDYKRVQIDVSWSGSRIGGKVSGITDIAPKDLAQECSTGGGILSVSVSDGFGAMISSPLIEIKDPASGLNISTFSPIGGQHYFSLATTTYKVVVSKLGYGVDMTYGTSEVTTPDKPNPLILGGELITLSFLIDKVGNLSIDTLSPWGADYFSDTFLDQGKISENNNLLIKDSQVILATDTFGYLSFGNLVSSDIFPGNLVSWNSISFSDYKPSGTDLKYQIYFASDTSWILVPDGDLPGNSAGFSSSPVNLSGLPALTYSKLRIRADFSTDSTSSSPALSEWQASWVNNSETAIPNTSFKLHGNKTIGKDSSDKPVYKYSISTSTDSNGHKNISNAEADLYSFSSDPATGLNLVNINPSPQPVNLLPDSTLSVKLYLDSQNSLLLTLQDITDLVPVFAASARLYNNSLGYDNTQYTDANGQTYFAPLANANYNLEISSPNYLPTSTVVSVSGDKIKIIKLDQD
jgi:hypothetical protein